MTHVELFFDKDLADIVFEIESQDEWKELAGELDMDKQLQLIAGKDSPVPYPWMNTTMQRVFEELCPAKVDFRKYDKTPIPLEVMKQIAFSVREKHFQKIEIWYDDRTPDPVAVGYHGHWKEYQYGKQLSAELKDKRFTTEAEVLAAGGEDPRFVEDGKYLIAKWGDVKRPFEKLKEMAEKRFLEENSNKMQKDIKILQEKLKYLKENAKAYFSGEISKGKATTTNDW